MGYCLHPPRILHHHQASPNSTAACAPPFLTSLASFSCNYIHFTTDYNRIHSSILHLDRSFPLFRSSPKVRSTRHCRATSPGTPPPSEGKPAQSSVGNMSTFSRVRDAVRIFVAVLFWMSLFFWSCAWEGRNNGGRNKDSFRR